MNPLLHLRRLVSGFKRNRLDDDLAEEIRQHIELRRQALIDRGMDPGEAAYEARRMFGNVMVKREEARGMWGLQFVDTVGQDLRYGLRLLRRSPVFTIVAVLSLAIGIGATAAVFSLADAVLFRKLPVAAPEELAVFQWRSGPRNPAGALSGSFDSDGTMTASTSFSASTFETLRHDAGRVADVFGFASMATVDLTIEGQSEVGSGQVVSSNYFSAIGVGTAVGRPLVAADHRDDASSAAVISHGFWMRRFGGAHDVVGRTILVNRVPVTIVGVTPRGFHGLQTGSAPAITLPMAIRPRLEQRAWRDPTYWWVLVMARIRPDVEHASAQSMLDAPLKRSVAEGNPVLLAAELPRLELLPGDRGHGGSRDSQRETLVVMASVVGIVLLVACANVANLLLSRASARVREVALRVAIGAPRRRIVRQLLTEGLLLAVMGTALGLMVASSLAAALLPVLSGSPVEVFNLRSDWRVFLFTAAVATVCTLLFGLMPALRGTSIDVVSGLQEQMRGTATAPRRTRLTSALVVLQVALSVLLVTVAGLLVYSIRNLQRVDLGFDPSNTLLFRIDPARAGYDLPRSRALLEQVRQSLTAIPDVRAAAFSSATLLSGGGSSGPAVPLDAPITVRGTAEDRDLSQRYSTMRMTVSDEFFSTLSIRILRGRTFTAQDTLDSRTVAVINRALAQRLFGDADPIGRQFRWGTTQNSLVMEVVGLCADSKYTTLRRAAPPTLFTSYRQTGTGGMTFSVRTHGDPLAIVPQVREAVRVADAHLPISNVRTQDDQIQASMQNVRLMAAFATALGLVTLVLAAIGLYGVLSYSVSRRLPEIGIRVALGAERRTIQWMVLKNALLLTAAGVAVGAGAAYWSTSLVQSLLFGLSPTDRATFAFAAVAMTAVATAAAYIPARRAARVDPVVTLRGD
jgi:predicted permease